MTLRPEAPDKTAVKTMPPSPPPPAGAVAVTAAPLTHRMQQDSAGQPTPDSFFSWALKIEQLPTNVAIVVLGGAVGGLLNIIAPNFIPHWNISLGAAVMPLLGMVLTKLFQADSIWERRIRRREERLRAATLETEIAMKELETERFINARGAEKLGRLLSIPNVPTSSNPNNIELSSIADFVNEHVTATMKLAEAAQIMSSSGSLLFKLIETQQEGGRHK